VPRGGKRTFSWNRCRMAEESQKPRQPDPSPHGRIDLGPPEEDTAAKAPVASSMRSITTNHHKNR
jgi:hypothetical protein